MLIVNKKCPKCETLYDEALDECPRCGERNPDSEKYHIKNKIFWMPPLRQTLIFLVGAFGLILFEIIATIIVSAAGLNEGNLFNAIVLFSSYTVLFVAILIVLFPFFKPLAKTFNNYKPYLYGLIGAIILVGFSIAYSSIVNLFYKTSGNDNQRIAIQMVKSFPFPSIMILGLIGPIIEECTYRLGLFSVCRRFNRVAAYIITALVFGLIHFNFSSKDMINELINIPSYIFSGVVLSFLYEKKGPSASITAHVLNNLYSVIMILIIGG